MALTHDAQGFLVGDPIDLSQAVADWAAIRDDVRAIRWGVLGIERALNRAESEVRASAPVTPRWGTGLKQADPAVKAFKEVAQPMARGYALLTGRADGGDAENVAAVTRAVAQLRAARPSGTPAQPRGRDDKGRFIRAPDVEKKPGNGKKSAADKEKAGDEENGATDEGQSQDGAVNTLPERLVAAIKESSTGLEEADPAVKAFREVAQPMARGYELLTGGDRQKKQERWLRRIWTVLTGFRKEEGLFNKVATKLLKAIEKKKPPDQGRGGLFGGLLSGLFGGLGRALTRIPIVGGLLGVGGGLLKRAGRGLFKGAGRLLGVGAKQAGAADGGAKEAGLLGKTGGLLKGAGKLGRLFKRIPILGALLGGIGTATDIYDSETDDTLTRREKDKKTGAAVGGFAGSLAGMGAGASAGAAIGTLIFPGVGTAIGGAIGAAVGLFLGEDAGQILGDTVGGWVSDLREADIPGKIAAAWTATTEAVMSAWNATVAGVTKGWDVVVSGFNAVGEGIGNAWGKSVELAKAGWEGIMGLYTSAYEGLKSLPVIGPAIKAVEGAAKKTAEVVISVATDAKALAVKAVDKAGAWAGKAVEGVKAGVEYLGNHTAVGRGAKVAGQGVKAAAQGVATAANRAYRVTASAASSALATIMPKGYRHKALFDGIKGGEKLANYGTYTDEEAARIRALKTRDANTSANVAGGMSQAVQDKISAQAKQAGLDPVMMQKIAAMESGGNADAISSTGAIGIYQFIGQTATGVGIKNRFDVDQNIAGAMKLTQQNQADLIDADLPVTAENLYMMHQLGPPAAKEVIRGAAQGKSKQDLSAHTQQAMNLNYGANSKSAADYIATNKKALDDRYAAVTKDVGGAASAIAQAGPPSLAAADQVAAAPAPAPAPAAAPAALANSAVAQTVTPPAAPNYAGPAATPVVAAVAVPPVPAGPQAAPVTEALPVTMPMATNNARQLSVVVAGGDEIGQDLRERGIAHIATGGLSA